MGVPVRTELGVDLSEGGCYIDSIVEVAESEPLTLD